ncbi:MAG: prepilin peptidase [Deltaproteobacteria bacterium]|nr:prepilin peptidase [Deltaproteobacteria bacterium]
MELFFIIILSLLIGSFLNVCIYRIPKKESIILPRSHCPSCQKTLEVFDLIPIFSYLFLKGKCRFCKHPISFTYPLVEILTSLGSVFLFLNFSLSSVFFLYSFLFYVLVVITFIDLKHFIIPDVITLPNILLGFLLSLFGLSTTSSDSLLGILIGGGILYGMGTLYYVFTKKEGMGGGDIKLMAMLGAFLGSKAALFIILISSVLGAFGGFLILFVTRQSKETPIPFGPYIALASMIYIFYGELIIKWYFGDLFFT